MGHPPAIGTFLKCTGLLDHFCCFNCVPGTTGLGNSLHFFFLGKFWIPRGGATWEATAGGGQCSLLFPLV